MEQATLAHEGKNFKSAVLPRSGMRVDNAELHQWMERIRDRCQVLENVPLPGVADASWNSCNGPESDHIVLESSPLPFTADAGWGIAMEQTCAAVVSESVPSLPTADARHHLWRYETEPDGAPQESWQLRVQKGRLLPPDLRARIWADQMQVGGQHGVDSETALVPALLLQLQSGTACSSVCSTSDKHANGSSSAVLDSLVAAFLEKYLPWRAGGQVFVLLAQLLFYHCPQVAAALEEAFATTGYGLPMMLEAICGGGRGLGLLLFSPISASDYDAVLFLCDRLVMEAREMLLVFIVVALMMDAPVAATSGPEVAIKDSLRGLGSRRVDQLRECINCACALYESTPLSMSSSLPTGEASHSMPYCTISPDEVLTHVFETPSVPWRLVVVDVRQHADAQALPVCMQLGVSQNRQAVLRDLPYEESIHLCLVGDKPPAPGDEALELCRYLTMAPVLRRHVSVAAGGWPAVGGLAVSLGLELLALEPEPDSVENGAFAIAAASKGPIASIVDDGAGEALLSASRQETLDQTTGAGQAASVSLSAARWMLAGVGLGTPSRKRPAEQEDLPFEV